MEWMKQEIPQQSVNIVLEIREVLRELQLVKEKMETLYDQVDIICAGGAPRDWLHGWMARDFDFFYYLPEVSPSKMVLDDHIGVKQIGDEYSYGGDSNILTVHEYRLKYKSVQLIRCVKPPLEVAAEFPINLSQIAMNCNGEINSTSLFKHGVAGKTIQAISPDGCRWSYLQKILPRFSDYAYIPYGWREEDESE